MLEMLPSIETCNLGSTFLCTRVLHIGVAWDPLLNGKLKVTPWHTYIGTEGTWKYISNTFVAWAASTTLWPLYH